MECSNLASQLDQAGDIIRLQPQIVGRFYGDGNRLGQRGPRAAKPAYYKPERWIGSSTAAVNPPGIPSGGVSQCASLKLCGKMPALKALVADPEIGPRLLGEKRFRKHEGCFRVLLKLLDARFPIPFHVHADDRFVSRNPKVYANERFGKDEAYHFLDVPKGDCSYTHVGLYPGVTMKDVVAAMRRGTDHVLELSPAAYQNYGEGFIVRAGLLHRPGTALTLEIQQPSDVYTMFQTDFGGEPLAEEALHPGFKSIEAAADAVVNLADNRKANLLESSRLTPTPVKPSMRGGKAEWIFPPSASKKFSGIRLTVESAMKLKFADPCLLFVWRGQGTLDGQKVDGGAGPVGKADEFFLGAQAVGRGVELRNTGKEPLIAFAMFATEV